MPCKPFFCFQHIQLEELQPVMSFKSKYLLIQEGAKLRIQQLRIRTETTIILKAN